MPTATVRNHGCDLHFTAGDGALGGLRRFNALNCESGHSSALLLAESMQKARAVPNVVWVADGGGSVILTQAFKILANRGVTLDTHTAFLSHPTSSPGDALRLAHQLKLNLNEEFARTGWNPAGASMPMVLGIGAVVAGASSVASHANTAYSLGQSVKDTVTKEMKR